MSSPANIAKIGENFLLWGWQAFSIGYFVPRLFAPWHRDITGYGRGFDLGRWIKVWSWNLISRLIGAVMRVIVMIIGLFVEGVILMVTVLAFFLWLILPVVIPGLIIIGIMTLFL